MSNLLFLIPDYVDINKNYIEIFGLEVYYYAIAITLGMVACVLVAIPLVKKRGLNTDFLLDLMIGIIPCSIICARLWYVIFDIKSFDSIKDVINIREGGLAIYGGVAGGALGITIVCLIKKVGIVKIFDIGATMLPLGQAIGRWGNYFNQEVYGSVDVKEIGFPISVYIQECGEYHYALFFWESLLNIILFAMLYLFAFKYKGKSNGYSTAFYFMGYGLIRLIMEPLRDAQYNLPLFGIEALGMVWVSIALILAGVAVFACVFVRDMKNFNWKFKDYFKTIFANEAGTNRDAGENKDKSSDDEKV